MKNNNDLENKLLYRLVSVAYTTTLALCLLTIAVLGFQAGVGSNNGSYYININKSYVTCDNGNTYTFRSLDLYDTYNSEKIKAVCAYGFGSDLYKKYLSGDYSTQKNLPNISNYEVTYIKYPPKGSWMNALLWWVLGIVVVYGVLNIVRETLVYIFFGVPISWGWLRIHRRFQSK